jgi:hypothetical protein
MFDICKKFPNSIYMTIHNEGIFEGPQMLDNDEFPNKAYKNSDNGGNMPQNDVSFNWRDIIPTLLQTLQRHLLKLSWVLEDRNKLGRELGIFDYLSMEIPERSACSSQVES